MPVPGCRNLEIQRRSRSDERIACNCGWELRLGYGVAVSLAIFEAKRFFLLALELFVEWQVIRFAGGYTPVALTFVDITLGFPCALAAVYTIRKRQDHPFCPKSRRFFGYLLAIISTCAFLNVATMVSIGYYVSVRKGALASVFNASMQLYVTSASSKYAVDQIQFVLQCCGHTSYSDWFLYDWQVIDAALKMVDYAPREDMSRQRRISDEIYRDRGVPFSCCNFRVLRACVHSQMTEDDVDTINIEGCEGVLSNVLVRIVFVAYVMTTMLVLTQALLAFFVARIAKKFQPNKYEYCSECSNCSNGAFRTLVESTSPNSSEEYSSPSEKRYTNSSKMLRGSRGDSQYSIKTRKASTGSRKKRDRRINKNGGSGAVVSGFSDFTQDSMSSGKGGNRDTARIKPSVHVEHRVPKKKSGVKITR